MKGVRETVFSNERDQMKTEREKMIAGEVYQPWDKALVAERASAKKLCHRLNQLCPILRDQRLAVINQLLGYESNAHINSPFFCDYGYNIKLGQNFYANHGCTILDGAPVIIGDDVLLAPGVVISTATHPLDPSRRISGEETAHTISIGNRVWLGANVTVCPGVTIGDNVVVGAGSVVVRDLPANTVCVGAAAKPIRTID